MSQIATLGYLLLFIVKLKCRAALNKQDNRLYIKDGCIQYHHIDVL